MRVGYVNPTILVRRPLAELASRFKGSVVLIPRKPFSKQENPWHNKLKCKVYSYPAISIPGIQYDWPIPISPSFFYYMWKMFKNCDIIHIWTFFYIGPWTAILFKLFSKTKLIMSCDTVPSYTFKSGLIDRAFNIFYFCFNWVFDIPDAIHVYTPGVARDIQALTDNTTIILPTGVDMKKFNKLKRDKSWQNPMDNRKFIIATYAGMITKRKGIDTLLKVQENEPGKYRFHIYGEGPDYFKYIEYSITHWPYVKFYGWSENLPQDLKNSDVCILLSRGEGLPGTIMEAMACKLPVIATNIPGNNDLVIHGKTGYLVNNKKQTLVALKKLENGWLRYKLGNNGYKEIQKYDWKIILPEYNQMYEAIL